MEEKNVNPSYESIDRIISNPRYIINDPSGILNGVEIELTRKEYKYHFIGTISFLPNLKPGMFSDITLKNEDLTLLVDNLFIRTVNFVFSEKGGAINQFVGELHGFSTVNNLVKEKYIRKIVPLETNKHDIYSYLETEAYKYKNFLQRGLVHIDIDGSMYHFFINQYENKYYLIIDNYEKMLFDEFIKDTYAILVGYGFITSHLPGDQAYYILSDTIDFVDIDGLIYRELTDTIDGHYCIIHSNPHSFIEDKNEAEKQRNKFKVLTAVQFSAIITKIMKDEDLLRSIIIILQANNLSLEVRNAQYAIALETITGIVVKEHEEDIAPITNMNLRDDIIKSLIDRLKEYSKKLNPKQKNILESRIRNINQPTNIDKLILPFKIYNIELTDNDNNIIKNRNILLHGKVPKIPSEYEKVIRFSFQYQYYVALRLHKLLYQLLLNYFEYEGSMINYSKLHTHVTGIDVEEDVIVNVESGI